MLDYIKWIRERVGQERVIINYSGGWVENEDGLVMLQKRSKEKEIWGFPGGAINIGETAMEAAIREVKEESGFLTEVIKFLGVYTCNLETYPNSDKTHSIVFFFKLKILSGDIRIDNIETHDIQFFHKDSLPNLYSDLHNQIAKDVLNSDEIVVK